MAQSLKIQELELVIFDMDGLMFDTERIAFTAWQKAASDHGYEIDDILFKSTIGANAERTRELYLKHFDEVFPYENIRNERLRIVEKMIKENGILIKDGLYEMLEYLRTTRLKKAVATSTSRERGIGLLKMAGIDTYFDYILCGDEVEKSKPHPEIFLKVAEKLGCLPEKSLVLEDSIAGIMAAHHAGMLSIMIPDMQEPDENVKTLFFKQMRSLHDVQLFLSLK